MKKNNILGLTVAIITASMIFIGCQNTETSSGDSTGSSNGSTVTESSMSDDDNDVQSISGTIINNFHETPDNYLEIMSELTSLSPAVVKIAVMANTEQDVLDVMNYTRGFKTLNAE